MRWLASTGAANGRSRECVADAACGRSGVTVAKGAAWIESGYDATAPMAPVAGLAVVGA